MLVFKYTFGNLTYCIVKKILAQHYAVMYNCMYWEQQKKLL